MYLQRIWLAFLCLHCQLSVSNGGMCREEKSQLGFALLNRFLQHEANITLF